MNITKITNGGGRIKFIVVEGDDQIQSYAEILSIFVDEDKRQKGLGTDLIKKIKELAKSKGIYQLCVKANTDGASDIFGKFLTKNGFRQGSKKEFATEISK